MLTVVPGEGSGHEGGKDGSRSLIDEIVREGARRMLAEALAAEVDAYIARFAAERDEDGHRLVVRNGYHQAREVLTAAGAVEVTVPRVNDKRTDPATGERQRFSSAILPPWARKTPKITEVLPLLYLHGLSSGDFVPALGQFLGSSAGLSAPVITRLTETWQAEQRAFAGRDLAGVDFVYLWADGIHVNIRLEEHKLCLLVMIGVRADGRKELIALADGYRESAESWADLLRDCARRGMRAPLLAQGGVRAVAQVAGVSESTVREGVFELEEGQDPFPDGRARREGGGRKSAEELDAGLVPALLALVDPDERGDPESPLRWTTKSLRHLATELTRQRHPVSAPTVGRLLRVAGFSLQANAKTLEGAQHPDRDAQFRYINEQVKDHQAGGEPVISVDTKKREQLGRLPMAGREWRPKGEPVEVEDHSFFTGPEVEQAIPYGIYDITRGTGWVNVGTDHDTSVFAVESIRRWWRARGRDDYPDASRLLITADAGGSNSYRYRAWKSELAALAAETGLVITVCHFPPGTQCRCLTY